MASGSCSGGTLTPTKTPKKNIKNFFSPSGENICICCQNDVIPKRKIHLWNGDVLTSAGLSIECASGLIISTTEFQIVCEGCLKKCQTMCKKKELLRSQITNGRQDAQKFVRRKFKRGTKKDGNEEDTTSKKNRRKELFEPLVPLVSKKVSVNFNSSYDNDTCWEIILLYPGYSLYKSQGQGRCHK